MLNEYVAHQRAAEWRNIAAQHRLLATNRHERYPQRHRWRNLRIWTHALDRPPARA